MNCRTQLGLFAALLVCVAFGCGGKKGATTKGKSASSGSTIDIYKYVSKDIQSIGIVRPQKIINHPFFALLPPGAMGQLMDLPIGVDELKGIVQITVLGLTVESLEKDPQVGIVMEFASADAAKSIRSLVEKGETSEVDGKTVYPGLGAEDASEAITYVASDTVILMGATAVVKSMMKGEGDGQSAAATQMKKLDDGGELVFVTNLDAHKTLIKTQTESAKAMIPPHLSKFLTVLDHVQTVGGRLNMTDKQLLKVSLAGKDAAAAKEINTLASEALVMGQSMFKQFEPFIKQALQPKELADMLAAAVKGAKVSTSGNDVALTIPKPDGFDKLPELLKPAIEAAAAARRAAKRSNDLKMVGIAIQLYQDSQGKLPTNIVDKNGKPLLSWRVQILPYMQLAELAQQFKKDEPWDSDANKKLLTKMPEYYGDNKKGIATVLSFNGKRPTKYSEIVDGTINTMFGVLVDEASGVPWTKPADLDPTAEAVLKAVEKTAGDRIKILAYDGRVRGLPKSVNPADLKGLIDHKDGKGPAGLNSKKRGGTKRRDDKKGGAVLKRSGKKG